MLGGRLRVVTARVVCRLDVLVEPERVPRIVFILQSEEPPEVVAVGGPDPCASLGVQVVDIYFPAREGLHRRPDRGMDTAARAQPASLRAVLE